MKERKVKMEKFVKHEGIVAPLDRVNVDTDQIIPKQFLKRIERTGFGKFAFYDWRYLEDGVPNPDFILNHPKYSKASVLVAGPNFGSGSSREHAPWALSEYGFKVIISTSFADIFRNNCLNVGVLPVQISPIFLEKIFQAVHEKPQTNINVNLKKQKVSIVDIELSENFEINEYKKNNMLNGFDDIDYLLEMKDSIIEFSKNSPI